jgi:hypothetical protein
MTSLNDECCICGGTPSQHHPLDPDPDACLEFTPYPTDIRQPVDIMTTHLDHNKPYDDLCRLKDELMELNWDCSVIMCTESPGIYRMVVYTHGKTADEMCSLEDDLVDSGFLVVTYSDYFRINSRTLTT